MTLVMKKFTTRLSWKPKLNRKPRFFSAKPTETDGRETFWNRNNTRPYVIKQSKQCTCNLQQSFTRSNLCI